MSPESDMLSDLRPLLAEHGVMARWQTIDLLVLVSRVRSEQQIDLGGFVESPDLSVRVPKSVFPAALPKFGERFEVAGAAYRISKVAGYPRSPLLTLTLTSTDG